MTVMTAVFHSRPRAAAGLLVGMSLLLGACGDATAEEADLGADQEDAVPVGQDDPAPEEDDPVTDDDAAEPAEEAGDPERSTEPSPATQDGDCSAQGHTVTIAPAEELPEEVVELRELLIDAALRCDEQLLYTAIEESEQFTFTFGAGTDALGMWWDLEAAGEAPFLRLAQVLATTPGLTEDGEIHAWPRVTTGRPEDTTAAAWQEATWLDDPAAAAEQEDGYLDWRAGISTDGQWRFFVRGD